MNTVLLGYLCAGMTLMVAYAISERLSAGRFRRTHLQQVNDEVRVALLTELRLRKLAGRALVAAGDHPQADERDSDESEAGSDLLHALSVNGRSDR